MSPQVVPLPLSEPLLETIAAELSARLPGAAHGDYSGALVLLPSTRACRTLGQLVFEASGREAVLLPRILTPRNWRSRLRPRWASRQRPMRPLIARGR
jgi:hypothetical protein